MSNEAEEQVQALRESPRGEGPRLVCADWCEEQGNAPRAELIRLQAKRESLPSWDPQVVTLELAERALLTAHQQEWAPAAIPGVVYGSYRGGFIDTVGFETLGHLAQHGDSLMRRIPFRSIALRWPRLDDRPALKPMEGVTEVQLIGTLMQYDDLEWLMNSPLLSTIDTLSIIGSEMNDQMVAALATSPYLAQLRVLRLPGHGFTNEGMATLIKRAKLPALRELDLSVATQDALGSGGRIEPTFDDVSAIGLGYWGVTQQLTSLDITGHQIGPRGLQGLLASENLTGLKRLRLKSITDYDMDTGERPENVFAALSTANADMRLDELDIGENELSGEEIMLLAQHPCVSRLKALHVDTFNGSLEPLFSTNWFKKSLHVVSMDNPGSAAPISALLRQRPKRLHTIKMVNHYGWSTMTGAGAHLRDAPATPSLLSLNITGAALDDEDLKALSNTATLPNLVSLACPDIWGDESALDVAGFLQTPFGEQLKSFHAKSPDDRLPPIAKPSLSLGRWDRHEI